MLYKIALTGGPCSGKSSILAMLEKELKERGFTVFTSTETAREVVANGINIKAYDYEYTLKFQDAIMKWQKLKEELVEQFAKIESKNNPTIILYDRTILDNRAYLISQYDYEKLLSTNELQEYEVSTKYDMILYLISLASIDDMEYITDEIRWESKEYSKTLDKKTLDAYMLNENINVFLPTDDIEIKKEKVLNRILDYIDNKTIRTFDNEYEEELNNEALEKIIKKLNNDNSKTIYVTNYHINNKKSNYKLIKQEYKQQTVYYLQDLDLKQITIEEFEKQLNNNIIGIEEYREIRFIENNELNIIRIYKNSIKLIKHPLIKEDKALKLVRAKNV